ncbi:MAG: hypothetical protein ACRCZF_05220 [Gemmataceae bacterium]
MIAKCQAMVQDDAIWAAIQAVANELLAKGTISGRLARHHLDRAEA